MRDNFIIGASTGYLYANNISSINEHEKILRESGSEGFEINLGPKPAERIKLLLGPERFGKFKYRALHLSYDRTLSLENQLMLIKSIVDGHEISTAVIHPDVVTDEYYQKALAAKIPLSTENMDKDKTKGVLISELELILKTYDIKFVLDIQHAYEHDHKMNYAKDIFEMGFDKLVHLHVSGETENNIHSLVHLSRNASEIVNFTGYVLSKIDVPIILEGEYKNSEELKHEVEFLSKELGLKK